MTIGCFNNMMGFLREQTRNFCREYPSTLDEVKAFVKETSWFCWCVFARGKGNETQFREAVRKFILNEIMRVCA